MLCRACLISAVILILAAPLGCQQRIEPAPVIYAPPINQTDFASDVALPPAGFALLTERATEGRFACTIAVAKLTAKQNGYAAETHLAELTPAEQAYWVETFRGEPWVRDLQFVEPVSLRTPREGDPDPLCLTARDLGATLLLKYLPARIGPNSAEAAGVLYSVAACRPVAVLYESGEVRSAEGLELTPDEILAEMDDETDSRPYSAFYQTTRRFEMVTKACVRQLIQRDAPMPTTQPHRWHVLKTYRAPMPH